MLDRPGGMPPTQLTKEMMMAAKDNDARTMARALASGMPPDAANSFGQTSLHVAALWGNNECATVLLKSRADVNVINSVGTTPLHFAAQKDNLDMAVLLLSYGANKRAKAKNGLAPWEMATSLELRALLGGPSNALHQAIQRLDLVTLQKCLAEEPDLCERDGKGRSPLHLVALECVNDAALSSTSVAENHPAQGLPMLKILVGAIEARDEQAAFSCLDDAGLAAMHILVQARHLPATAALLAAGADPNVQSRPRDDQYRTGQWGRTAADGSKEVLRPGRDQSSLHLAIDCDAPSDEMVELLLSHRADPNVADLAGRTPLHLALDFEEDRNGPDLALAKTLLEHGADATLGNSEIGSANSCVHAAADRNQPEVLRLLLAHGTPHSTPGKGGFTPLALAARAGIDAVLPPLLEAGANPDALMPLTNGKSARELAVINKRTAVLEVFDAHAAANGSVVVD